jgi:hypothetical protein
MTRITSLIFLTVAVLLVTAHHLPAPISEQSPSPAPEQSAKPKPKPSKPKSKKTDNEEPSTRSTPEPAKPVVAGAWSGAWYNSRGNHGTLTITLTEEPGGIITGDAGPGIIENGHRTGNVVTYTFRRSNRDYQVTLTLSAHGTAMNGGYKVTRGQQLVYSGTYDDLKRR